MASKALWDLLGWLTKLVLKDKKEKWDLRACRDLKESLVNQFASFASPSAAVSPARSTVKESASAKFQCSATGNPRPSIIWSKLNSQTKINQSAVAGGTLLLKNLKGGDAGVYKCSAVNTLGQAHAVGHLVVNGEFMDTSCQKSKEAH